MKFITLNNDVKMPIFGLGLYKVNNGNETINIINSALKYGYRSFDTASLYGNEKSIGKALNLSPIKREEIFLTTKVWNSDQGYDNTIKAFNRSLNFLKTDYIDLYLIHWPVKNKFIETWKAIEELYEKKLVRAIGVSNFLIHHLEELFNNSKIKPAINQIEFHPYLYQEKLLKFCKENNIFIEAWAPLMRGEILKDPLIKELSLKYKKTEAQIILRWDIENNIITIPKSVHDDRIKENISIFDFEISDNDIKRINNLDKNLRCGPDPDNFNF